MKNFQIKTIHDFWNSVSSCDRYVSRLFSYKDIKIKNRFGDMLERDVVDRHNELLLSFVRSLYPKLLIETIADFIPIRLCLLTTVKK